jgi:hypothetical protein
MRSSTNSGVSWSGATTVAGEQTQCLFKNQKSSYLAGGSTTGRDGMPGCTDFTTSSGAARVLCVFETTEGTAPRFTVKSVVSSNDGVSFSGRAQVFVPGGSGTNGSYPIKLKGSN